MRRSVFFAAVLALAGCNNNTSTDTGPSPGTDGGSDAFVTPTVDSGTDAFVAPTVDGGHDAAADANTADAGCTGVELTVHNYLAWCGVAVNGGTSSTADTQTVCVPANTSVSMIQTAASSSFILGKWHHTSGDTGTGENGTVSGAMSTATVMTGAAGTSSCVWVCCPFTNGTGCDGVADQCH